MIGQIIFESGWILAVGLPLAALVMVAFVWSNRRRAVAWRRIGVLTVARSLALLILLLLAARPVQRDIRGGDGTA